MWTNSSKNYESDLRNRQRKHLEGIAKRRYFDEEQCRHDACQSCIGTGIKSDGTPCVHMISCKCPKCSPGH